VEDEPVRATLIVVLSLAHMAGLPGRGSAQAQGRRSGDETAPPNKDYSKSSVVTRMMAFDKNKDGKLTRDEITDERLLRLFDQADTNKDGVVTREELIALARKLEAEVAEGGRSGPGGPGGPPGRGGFGRPPRPGQILPPFVADRLELSADQKKQLDELQKEVDARLARILTDEQRQQLKEMQPGPGGGPGGPGRPGGGRGPGPDGGGPADRPE
jgi:hypothetical protein